MKTFDFKNSMTIKDVSAALDRSVQRIHAMIAEGKLKATKVAPGLWAVEKKSVEQFLKSRTPNRERRK